MQTVQSLLETNKENNSKKRNKLRESKDDVDSKIVRAPRSPDRRPSTGASAPKDTPEKEADHPARDPSLVKQDTALEQLREQRRLVESECQQIKQDLKLRVEVRLPSPTV